MISLVYGLSSLPYKILMLYTGDAFSQILSSRHTFTGVVPSEVFSCSTCPGWLLGG
jgi:hypothetical protein